MGTQKKLAVLLFLLGFATVLGAAEVFRSGRVRVEHPLDGDTYAKAIATVVDFAAERARKLGFDMPDEFVVRVTVDPAQRVRLSTTGDEQIHLLIESPKRLGKPATSGVKHVYGFCHEVGHCCMYRVLKERAWMTTGGAEGWAHYWGARTLDLLWKDQGKDAWPDTHDYRSGGLSKSVRGWKKSEGEIDRGAWLWSGFVDIVGEDGVAAVFADLERAGIDSFNAVEEVGAVLAAHKKGKKLTKWWKDAADVMVAKLSRSDFETGTISPKKLDRKKARTLTLDSGNPTGKRSWPGGSGAAVKFDAGEAGLYVTEVQVYGQRYGRKTDESFTVWLLDDAFKPFRRFAIPYEKFAHGKPHWETLVVEPTLVPRTFHVCVVFNAESTKGVFRYFDEASSGGSSMGVPGESSRAFGEGDWLIRAVVAKKK